MGASSVCRESVAERSARPALNGAVVHVVSLGAEKQVRRVAARRVVALVTDEHAIGNWPEVQLPRNAMGKQYSSGIGPACADGTVAGCSRALPAPATIALYDFRPKPLCQRVSFVFTATSRRHRQLVVTRMRVVPQTQMPHVFRPIATANRAGAHVR